MLCTHLRVVGRGLVRVLPVTQPRDALVSDRTVLWEAFGLGLDRFGLPFDPLSKPARDRRVVLGGPTECRERQPAADLFGDLTPVLQGRQHLFVVLERGYDRHGVEVLRSGPQHRWAADVYLLDNFLLGSTAGDGLLEGVEVDADEVYRADVLLDELLYVVGVSEVGEDAAVDPGVQRLDPPAEHLRRAGHPADGYYLHAGLRERLRGPSGRDDLEPHREEPPREVHDTILVRHRDQRPSLHTSTLPKK